ncbi:MAG: hypothetical protein WKG07_04765 [Hymenobacter sp.]
MPFRPGMTASVDIIAERKAGVLSVPLGRRHHPLRLGRRAQRRAESGRSPNRPRRRW